MLSRFFNTINDIIRGTEASFVNLISAIVPWLAPLAPAWMSYVNLQAHLNFPQWVAGAIALVIEGLGMSTVSTWMGFWEHNRRYKATGNKTPAWIPLSMFGFYLMLVLTLNVTLEIQSLASLNEIFARALVTLLSVPAVTVLAVRSMHQDILNRIEEVSEKRKKKHKTKQAAMQVATDWRKLPHDHKVQINYMDTSEIVYTYEVSERTARNWKDNAENYVRNLP